MPHFILTSAGTHGDVFPYIALGKMLLERGNRVTLVVPESYGPSITEMGMEFASIVSTDEVNEFLDNPDVWHPMKSALLGAKWGVSSLKEQFELLADVSSGDDAILAASPAIMAARMVQEKLGRPMASVYYLPWIIASSQSPPAMTSGITLPQWAPAPLGRLYWWGADQCANLMMGKKLNGFRATLDLPPVKRIFKWWMSPDLCVGLFPSWYAVPQSDWPPQMKVAGFPAFDGEERELDGAVRLFCRGSGEDRPVIFTFGSGMKHAGRLFEAAVEACERSGRRGILLARDSAQIPDSLPDSVRHFDYVPLGQLLPLCSGIVHHGGMGTTARSLAAGTPQLIIPHAWDQLDNALRVIRLGGGARIRRGRVTAKRVATALDGLLTEQTSVKCWEIAEQYRMANLPERAAQWLEEYAEGKL